MSPKTRRCVWCGSAANSKEQVYPQWLQQLPGPANEIAERGRFQPGESRMVARNTPDGWVEYQEVRAPVVPVLHEVQVKAVCRKCNEGWMADLERVIQPVVRRMVGSRRIRVEPADQEVLAAWGHKTFLMYDQWESPGDRRYRASDYETFYRDRLPPSNSRIYTGYGSVATFGMHSDSNTLIPPGANARAFMEAHHPNCGSSYIAIDGLFLVEHWFSESYPVGARIRRFHRPPYESSHRIMRRPGIHQIWPAQHDIENWRATEMSPRRVGAAQLSLHNTMRHPKVHAQRVQPPA